MPLTPGARIGIYEVTGSLGAGGMGEVHRARDTTLDRDVALKVLPEAFSADPERQARFEREARVLASLNHPNIAQIYGFEASGESRALVLELVEGPTVADLIEGGPIPLDDALQIAWQIASALQAAHEAGVVHRDLKPANVKVREDGTVKVLDFGLAKALEPEPAPEADVSQSPTLTVSATRMGVIMGTPSYMSPEQAAGTAVGIGTDLWSFGVVLYEMLAGERLFGGETVPHVLARVLDRELDLSNLPPSTPAPVRRVLRRCLERDQRRRMRDAGEAISDLEAALKPEDAATDLGTVPTAPPPVSRWRQRTAWAALGLALGAAAAGLALWALAPPPAPSDVRRLSLDLPSPMARGTTFALSPDGSTLAYVGRDGRNRRLMVRRLDQADAQPLAGGEGALDPFFSPDGAWIGFFAGDGPGGPTERLQPRWTLMKAPAAGGAPVALAENVPATGASWGDDDRIVIGALGGLLGVPGDGGTAEALFPAGAVPELAACMAPHVLPGSSALLFVEFVPDGELQLKAVSLPAGEPRLVASAVTEATYAPTGHLLLREVRQAPGRRGPASATLMAAPFDAERLELTGPPVPVVPDAGLSAWAGDGTLVYAVDAFYPAESRRTLAWVDREGGEEPLPAPPRAYRTPRVSPDGGQIALAVTAANGNDADVVIYDVAREASNRLTFEGWNVNPLWSPDGRRVVYTTAGADGFGLFRKAADGTGQTERLTSTGRMQTGAAWVEASDTLVVSHAAGMTDVDIHRLPLDGGASEPLIATAFAEAAPAVSPDGRWIAYQSNESGPPAVFVRPFPDVGGGKWQVSQGPGLAPAWSRDGRELFYVAVGPDGRAMMAVEYDGDPSFTWSRPERLFELSGRTDFGMAAVSRQWDVAPTGDRFLVIKEDEDAPGDDPRQGPTELVYVANWFTELAARVPIP